MIEFLICVMGIAALCGFGAILADCGPDGLVYGLLLDFLALAVFLALIIFALTPLPERQQTCRDEFGYVVECV